VLELLTLLLAKKIWPSGIPKSALRHKGIKSFNEVLGLINTTEITWNIDHEFFIDFYDQLWNDYKHDRGTQEISATGWSTDNGNLVDLPRIKLAHSNRFDGMPLSNFIDSTIKHLDHLLDYIA